MPTRRRIALMMFGLPALLAVPALAQRATAPAPRKQFEFRSLHLGDSLTKEIATEQLLTCHDHDDLKGSEFCVRDGLLSSLMAFNVDVIDRRVMTFNFNFEPGNFEKVLETFQAAWGAPTSRGSAEVQNRMGAKLQNSIVKWQFADGTLTLQRYGKDLIYGGASISHAGLTAALKRRRECAAAQTAKRDFGASTKLPDGCP